MGNKKQIQIDSDEFSSIVEKLHFLEESNSALVAIQNKLDRLNYFRSDLVLSYDIHHIVEKGLAKFQELVETKVCSVFLVDKRGFEFVRKISIPEELSSIVQKEHVALKTLDNLRRAHQDNQNVPLVEYKHNHPIHLMNRNRPKILYYELEVVI